MGYIALLSANLAVVKRSTVGKAQKAMAVLTMLSLFLKKKRSALERAVFFESLSSGKNILP